MKIFFIFLVIHLSSQNVVQENNNDVKRASLGLDLNKGTLLSQLQQLKGKVKKCLIMNGINDRSFNFCVGSKFEVIENIF